MATIIESSPAKSNGPDILFLVTLALLDEFEPSRFDEMIAEGWCTVNAALQIAAAVAKRGAARGTEKGKAEFARYYGWIEGKIAGGVDILGVLGICIELKQAERAVFFEFLRERSINVRIENREKAERDIAIYKESLNADDATLGVLRGYLEANSN